MDRTPLVSVIIAAHNAASELPRAVASVLEQSIGALEVIVIDDASSDRTAEVGLELAAADPRVVLRRAPRNLGPAGARNLGLDAARGAWIAVLDADDAYLPERLARLLELGQQVGADMVADNLLFSGISIGGNAPVMLTPDLLDRPRQVDAVAFLLGNLPSRSHPRVGYGFLKPVFRRGFLAQHGIRYDQRLRFAEDFELYLRCLIAGARFWLTPEPGYVYTVREGSLTDTHSARDLLRLRRVDRRLLARLETVAGRKLQTTLGRHLRSIDRRAIWRLFTDAVKARAWRRASRLAALSPYSTFVVGTELGRAAFRRLGRGGLPAPVSKQANPGTPLPIPTDKQFLP